MVWPGATPGAGHVRVDKLLEQAFDYVQDVTTPKGLTVVGAIPEYVRGTFFRIGPGGYRTKCNNGKTYHVDHLFDGFSQIHRFEILGSSEVKYTSRHTCDSLLENIRRNGSLTGTYTFGQGKDPCQSYFRKVVSTFLPLISKKPLHQDPKPPINAGVTISKDYPGLPNLAKGESAMSNLYLKTDTHFLQGLDPATLEPVGVAYQHMLHPSLVGSMSSAHARSCPTTGDIYNFNLEFGSIPKYRIFCTSATTGKTDILATISDAKPAYIHSFWITEHYVVLCIFGSHFALGGSKMLYTHNVLDAIDPTDPSVKNRFYVIDRTDRRRGILSTYESEAFFAFHSVNAWEEDGDDVVLEIPIYKDNSILKQFYYRRLLGLESRGQDLEEVHLRFTRWRLKNVAVKELDIPTEDTMELPTINTDYITRPHRYTYGISTDFPFKIVGSLVKFDSLTKTSKKWRSEGCLPGEPVFVGDPDGEKEDDGVLLTCVLDMENAQSYLLILDARNLVEICRILVGGVVNVGFHGMWDDQAKGRIISY
ncbi:carotenoid oxygenase [Ascobolus immersus RN42]|uniref:Carotenoid oxygenase n=1 Tax=Ascobolus immersus RN42 TaxID=1160509 RepID=A0A3N4IL58_ASCIM|nr:carotenoid oxygenase [Ascobolus immersus RN42]